MASISSQKYTPAEDKDIASWITKAAAVSDAAVLAELNTHLATRTTVLGTKPSSADVALYKALAPIVAGWTPEQRTGEAGLPHIVRLVDFVQNSALFELSVADDAKVAINADEVLYVKPPVDAKAEKERLKKEKAAAAAAATNAPATGETKVLPDRTKNPKDAAAASAPAAADQAKPKKEKKEKQPKPQKAPAVTTPPAPSLIDLRVGHILKAIQHPDADSLYVSTIAVGDKAGDDYVEYEGQLCRTVCSGLNGLIPLEEMQGRKVVVVCNLKPVKMRGIKSCAMVLAASPKLKEGETDDHKGPVELVTPPADAKAGERVYFEGWKGEPEGVLNPKKKIWEMFQPGFTTTSDLEVAFDAAVVKELGKEGLGKLVTESGGVCKVNSLVGALVR
ncbi:tRNA-aminoacylation cofactor arc1 [Ceratocystis fimbriata CBS 114723]|uniref:tRNA-aminoacylation cofactor arc1 n=1 Tax=Ceratocystis fimbriata CBS 114723 TaxID=1035309 RepID=A0A2C5WZN9_9PEZI|nr:tRNA-aminoacylation cofactor arc1 [Ceratocystis fimbriata CBS 114723]